MLTQKPMFVIANVNDQTTKKEIDEFKLQLSDNMKIVEVDVKIETDLNELSNEEKIEFMSEFDISESALSKIIKTNGYSLLDLKTFFTSGEKNREHGQLKSIIMLMNVQVSYIQIFKKDLSGLRLSPMKTISDAEASRRLNQMVYGGKKVKITLSTKVM